MTANQQELDDNALDAAIAAIARVEAPGMFAARVSAALDTPGTSRGTAVRIVFVTAAASLVLAGGVMWQYSRQSVSPQPPTVTSRAASLPDLTPAPAVAPVARESAAAAGTPPSVTQGHHRPLPQDDHPRALPALATLPPVGPRDISPAALQTAPLEIDRIDDLTPLTIQSGRDTSGRGDFR